MTRRSRSKLRYSTDDKAIAHSANGIAHFSSGSKTRSLQRPGLDDPHVILNSPKAGEESPSNEILRPAKGGTKSPFRLALKTLSKSILRPYIRHQIQEGGFSANMNEINCGIIAKTVSKKEVMWLLYDIGRNRTGLRNTTEQTQKLPTLKILGQAKAKRYCLYQLKRSSRPNCKTA